MTSYLPNAVLDRRYVFSGNLMLVQGAGYAHPAEALVRQYLQPALDWFSEPAQRGIALLLENDAPAPPDCRWIPIREYMAAGMSDVGAAARARALLNWRKAARFCGSCGGELRDSAEETARVCVSCGRIIFPAIEPAIIALVQKDGKLLLARHTARPTYRNTDVYTCIAGFVEQGESIEEAAAREIREEAGIEIQNLRYAGSQSWPFPNQLMLGFKAEWKSGELRPDKKELEDIRWFSRDSLPPIPPPGSIAWRLIMGEL
jgi:NAD+ diphosphatase